jgi:hypothetical protein
MVETNVKRYIRNQIVLPKFTKVQCYNCEKNHVFKVIPEFVKATNKIREGMLKKLNICKSCFKNTITGIPLPFCAFVVFQAENTTQ